MRGHFHITSTLLGAAMLIAACTNDAGSQELHGSRAKRPAAEQPLFASVASYKNAHIPSLEKYMLASLAYPVDGVVEDALREITRVKLAQPSAACGAIERKIRELTYKGNTPAIRYKAVLGLQVFENPGLFTEVQERNFRSAEEMFAAISDCLRKSLLTDKR